jgi:hypothetical protein
MLRTNLRTSCTSSTGSYDVPMQDAQFDGPHIVFATGVRWTPPANWPEVPDGWTPTPDWRPNPAWGPPPPGWAFLRLSDCAADANLPMQYRMPDLDARIKQHIATPQLPASAFISFLGSMIEIVQSAFKVSGEVARVGGPYRSQALRSLQDATDVLERAQQQGRPAPFIFFACIQDASSAVAMFAAAADQSADDGRKAENLAAFTGEAGAENSASEQAEVEQEIRERTQELFDATVQKVMAVMKEASSQLKLRGQRAVNAQRALRYASEASRLLNTAEDNMDVRDVLQLIEDLDSVGRRAAAEIGVKY